MTMKDTLSKYTGVDDLEDADHQLTFSLRPLLTSIFSPSLLQLSLTGILFIIASISLVGASVAAYAAFYYSYIPHPGFSRLLYLQYDVLPPSSLQQLPIQTHSTTEAQTSIQALAHTSFPYATLPLSPSDLVPNQPYRITIHLTLPRTPTNLRAGNFMLDLALLQAPPASSFDPESESASTQILRARRPAILTYRTYIHETLRRLITLPLLLLNFRSESENLRVVMFEYMVLPRGSEMPSALRVELQSPLPLQVTSASISFKAEFRGLRKLMRNHRIFSTLLFSTSFFAIAESVLVLICIGLGVRIVQQSKQGQHHANDYIQDSSSSTRNIQRIKLEKGAEADDEREEPPKDEIAAEMGTEIIKKEEEDESVWVKSGGVGDTSIDSGIGTSMESSGGGGLGVRRRGSGRGRD